MNKGDGMKKYIALFRGINIGGHHLLPMKELKTILEKHGAQNVRTYIQSGNAVFQHKAAGAAAFADKIGDAIQRSRGFRPYILLTDASALEKAIAENPFPEAEKDPKSLHVFFLASAPRKPDLDLLASIKTHTERFILKGAAFYLHAPEGVGRSKLPACVEKALGVAATARNWRTVCEIRNMAKE
jgi:uncharacterized protein (DUF1697 family)